VHSQKASLLVWCSLTKHRLQVFILFDWIAQPWRFLNLNSPNPSFWTSAPMPWVSITNLENHVLMSMSHWRISQHTAQFRCLDSCQWDTCHNTCTQKHFGIQNHIADLLLTENDKTPNLPTQPPTHMFSKRMRSRRCMSIPFPSLSKMGGCQETEWVLATPFSIVRSSTFTAQLFERTLNWTLTSDSPSRPMQQ